MKLSTLQDLYLDELRDIYDAETQLAKAIPQMIKAATSAELESALEEHLDQTKEHVGRLEQIFDNHGESPKGKKCKGMSGLIEEAKEFLGEAEDEVLDAGMIAAAQRIEHYEIAVYGCLATYANLLGNDDEAELLQQTLDEDKEFDETLTDIAESTINLEAVETEDKEELPEEEAPRSKRRTRS
jgi:ferritin-like metal-binding protein YciE